jgi:hypothetical protein
MQCPYGFFPSGQITPVKFHPNGYRIYGHDDLVGWFIITLTYWAER